MIQPAAPTLAPLVPTAPSPSGAGAGSGVFALSLAGFLDAGEASGEAIALPGEAAERHDDADGGNALPVEPDADAPAIDPAIAWLSLPAPILAQPRPIAFVPRAAEIAPTATPIPASIDLAAPLPVAAEASAVPVDPSVPAAPRRLDPAIAALLRDFPATILSLRPPAAARSDVTPTDPLAASVAASISALPVSASGNQPVARLAPAAIDSPLDRAVDVPGKVANANAPITAAPQPQAAQPAIAEAFAAVIRAAIGQDEPAIATRRSDELATQPATITPLDTKPVAVPATGDAQTPTLDLRQERWTHSIIDHIERLRDGIDAADTRIRLVPDALGSIDVSVRKDGDTLHVHFIAEQAATRTILQDAQPKLAEIAEQRGLKLGQAGVSGGSTDGNRQPPQPQSQPQQSHSPRPAPVRVTPATDPTDTRIA